MSIYKKRRLQSGLSKYTIAKEMGITEEQYLKLERGKVSLTKEWMDKFNNVINRAREIRLDRIQKLTEIKYSIDSGELSKMAEKLGYNRKTLGMALGYDTSTMSNVLNGKKSSDDLMEKVYDFLMNPTNKKCDDEPKVETKEYTPPRNTKIEYTPVLEARRVDPEEEKIEESEIQPEPQPEPQIETQPETQIETQPTPTNTNLETRIKMLEREKEILLIQLMRYEKLIDKM